MFKSNACSTVSHYSLLAAAKEVLTQGIVDGRKHIGDVVTPFPTDISGYRGENFISRDELMAQADTFLATLVNECAEGLKKDGVVTVVYNTLALPGTDAEYPWSAFSAEVLREVGERHGYEITYTYPSVDGEDVYIQIAWDEQTRRDINAQVDVANLEDFLKAGDFTSQVKSFRAEAKESCRTPYAYSLKFKAPYRHGCWSMEALEEMQEVANKQAKTFIAYVLQCHRKMLLNYGGTEVVLHTHNNPFMLISKARMHILREVARACGLKVSLESAENPQRGDIAVLTFEVRPEGVLVGTGYDDPENEKFLHGLGGQF